MQPVVNMITLGVKDLAIATEFYQNGLGFPKVVIDADRVSVFELSVAWVSLFPWDELAKDAQVSAQGEGFRGMALAQTVASEAKVDAILKQAVKAGGTLIKPGQKVFWGGYSGYFADPDGHLWEIAYNPFMKIGPQEA